LVTALVTAVMQNRPDLSQHRGEPSGCAHTKPGSDHGIELASTDGWPDLAATPRCAHRLRASGAPVSASDLTAAASASAAAAASPGALPRLRVVRDAGEKPAQLDGGRELAALLEDGADCCSLCFGDGEHRGSMVAEAKAHKPPGRLTTAAGCRAR
jgi:hypothetical protein